ncbi:phosphotriesterase-related protein [Isoptericola sp. b490]|uniref:phosphotriesterase family protein n=1 Tax=Actinotalea lenta TaxID=3064654 RepID=UPI0027122E12|nr:phosphotriesterase-related protein [Isoptericola sp. b490]MDO8121540.1 phosphotriesterase-related protein [Isoptericola sp. b490]
MTESPADPITVQGVLGPVPIGDLGMTLTHEHLFNELGEAVHPGVRDFGPQLAAAPVSPDLAWLLREDPYACPDNCRIGPEDLDTVVAELALLRQAGGSTVVNATTGPGRHPEALVTVAERTGLTVVMAGGWCLAHGDDDRFTPDDTDDLVDVLVREARDGVRLEDGRTVRIGVIGEIGVGPRFTTAERVTLVAACRGQVRTGLPLLVHLPGWQRRGHEVVDVAMAEGVDPRALVLCHMDPSGTDPGYQRELADRGVWLEFDMIGMPFNFPGEGQSPAVQDTVAAVAGLVRDGRAGQLLLSHDVFLKAMWTRNAGNGYAFVPTAFLPRLVDAGVPADVVRSLLTDNPAALFTAAHRSR